MICDDQRDLDFVQAVQIFVIAMAIVVAVLSCFF